MELGFVGMMVASVLFALGSSEESLCYILALFAYCCTLSFMMNYCTATTIENHVKILWAFVDMCFTVSARSDVSTWECIVQGPQQLNPEAEDDDGIHTGLSQSFS